MPRMGKLCERYRYRKRVLTLQRRRVAGTGTTDRRTLRFVRENPSAARSTRAGVNRSEIVRERETGGEKEERERKREGERERERENMRLKKKNKEKIKAS